MNRLVSALVPILVVAVFSNGSLVHAAAPVSPQILAQESIALPVPASTGTVPITLSAGGRSFSFTLRNNSALAGRVPAGVRVLLADAGDDGSWARLTYFDNGWHGVLFDGISLWLIEPASPTTTTPSRTGAVDNVTMYRAEDLQLPGFLFEANGHTAPLAPNRVPGQALLGELPQIAMAGVTKRLPITLVADTAFRTRTGANAEATLLTLFNNVDGIFSNQVGIGLELQHVELLSNDGPLTAPDLNTLLDQFTDFMFNGAGTAIPSAGNAHLFTSRAEANNGGIAWVGTLCSDRVGYGVNKFTDSINIGTLIFAHELGHNFGAPHDGQSGSACESAAPGLMAPTVGGTDQFSQCSIQQMQPEIADAFCLISVSSIAAVDFTGNWFNRQRDGEGVQISLEGDGATFVLSYYTYLGGRQVWMIGEARSPATGETKALTFDLYITSGADFGSRFNPANVVRRVWGTVKVTVDAGNCNTAQMVVTPALPEFGGAFTVPIERIAVRSSCN
ncbi:MAG: hypothetical protein COZ47_05150 [Lysobacterales bacterium CG_4_10_14_3_um_filter_64_11]|nr:MAG: hypothetical protein COZ47_05150 [Xanthomonadales bacterium CG_4_10_14_3_um_filter_64_11]